MGLNSLSGLVLPVTLHPAIKLGNSSKRLNSLSGLVLPVTAAGSANLREGCRSLNSLSGLVLPVTDVVQPITVVDAVMSQFPFGFGAAGHGRRPQAKARGRIESQFPFGFGAAGHAANPPDLAAGGSESQFPFGFGAAGHTDSWSLPPGTWRSLNSLSGLVLPVT